MALDLMLERTSPAVRAWLPDVAGWTKRSDPGPLLELRLASRAVTGRTGPIRVLLVEDDTTIAEMYRVQLDFDGFSVTVVSTGEAALAAMAASRPDIVLLDLLLPDRSGLEVMVEINKKFPEHPPVVILSNYGEPTMIERGLSLGAIEYLVKSRVTPDSVSRSIPGWIENDQDSDQGPSPRH
ncbi:MAG TPA: response regulator [Candidatus Sulfotelmatobacter sp.]|nr:response regulator [Candidatus Sulfotelmatobacter sp.]